MPSLPDAANHFPMIRGLDSHESRADSFVAGTDGCDIWEVDGTSRTVVDGHTADVHMVAPHPVLADEFVTTDESGTVFIWDAKAHMLKTSCLVGFKCHSVDVSSARLSGFLCLRSASQHTRLLQPRPFPSAPSSRPEL